jgi:hypothetical protein
MTQHWRRFLIGAGIILASILLTAIFLAYQMPELLIDWANLRYCG